MSAHLILSFRNRFNLFPLMQLKSGEFFNQCRAIGWYCCQMRANNTQISAMLHNINPSTYLNENVPW